MASRWSSDSRSFWPANIALDPDEVVESDDTRRPTTDGDDVCPREQLVKGADRFEIAEEIQRILTVHFERVVLAQSQCRCIQSEFQVGWCPAQGEIERRQRRGEATTMNSTP